MSVPMQENPPTPAILIDVPKLVDAYYSGQPDPSVPATARGIWNLRASRLLARQLLQRGAHPRDYPGDLSLPKQQSIDGPLYIGFDTHALSEPAFKSALEVLAGNGVDVMVDAGNGYTPTPVISHAILSYNRGRKRGLADGIVITPSHNPPRFGGFKYDPPHGGPADTHVTRWIEERANALIADGLRDIAQDAV